jgi:hypothetical protein
LLQFSLRGKTRKNHAHKNPRKGSFHKGRVKKKKIKKKKKGVPNSLKNTPPNPKDPPSQIKPLTGVQTKGQLVTNI